MKITITIEPFLVGDHDEQFVMTLQRKFGGTTASHERYRLSLAELPRLVYDDLVQAIVEIAEDACLNELRAAEDDAEKLRQ